ncbi:hypothetical protein M5E87_15745 [Flavonifractor plautii]|nr:hypothetical protein M5E87_15745 [Flavonifractor plautii]
MRNKRFSLAQLLLAIALTAAAVLGCGLLAVRAWMGEGGRSLVEGLRLVNTLFVGNMTRRRWWTPPWRAWCPAWATAGATT